MILLASVESGVLASPIALIVIGAAAFALPLLARRLILPAVVLEIIFGVIIGPEVLGVIDPVLDSQMIGLLAELGLLLLMFLAGFEIDFDRLRGRGKREVAFGLLVFGLIVSGAFFGAGFLDTSGLQQRIFLTLLISAASVGIVIPALRHTGRAGTRLGQITLITAILAEFLALLGIVVVGVIVEDGFGIQLLAIPLLFAVLGVVLLAIRRTAWWFPEKFERLFATDDPDELGIRASLAMLLVFAGLSMALGIEPILGAFLAGATFAFVFRDTGVLENRLSGFAFGFFVPIFFINIGITFPIRELAEPDAVVAAAALIGVAITVKIVPSLLLLLRRFSLREALGAGVLWAGQLSVIIALADLGSRLGLLEPALRVGAILLVAVTAILSPVVFRLLAPPLETKPIPRSSVNSLSDPDGG